MATTKTRKTRTITPGMPAAFKSRYGTLVTGTVRKVEYDGGVWNVTVEDDENGYLHLVNVRQTYTDPDSIAKLVAAAKAPHMSPGTLVRVDWGKPGRVIAGMASGDLGVVIADRRPKYRVNVAKLGGMPDQGYAQAQVTSLTVVDPAELLGA